MVPYSRPKRSDLYTLSQSKLLENHAIPFTAAHTYIAHIWQYPRLSVLPRKSAVALVQSTPSCLLTDINRCF